MRGSSTAGSGGGSTRGDAEGTGAAAAESASAVAASATTRAAVGGSTRGDAESTGAAVGGSTRGDAEGTGAAAESASATPREKACSKVVAIFQQLPQGAAMVSPTMTDAEMKLKNFTLEKIQKYKESLLSPEANGGITGSITQDSFKRLMVSLDDEPGNPYDFSKDTFVSLNLKVFVWQELSNIHVLVRKIFGLGRWSSDCSNDGRAAKWSLSSKHNGIP